MIAAAIVAAAAVLNAPAPQPRPCVGEIAHVRDADTLEIACDHGPPVVLRLRDVDAPESGHRARCAAEAAQAAQATSLVRRAFGPAGDIDGLIVRITPAYLDRYGRTVGDAIILEDVWRGWSLTAAIAGAGRSNGIETLQPWPHDTRGRALTPKPDWCTGETHAQ